MKFLKNIIIVAMTVFSLVACNSKTDPDQTADLQENQDDRISAEDIKALSYTEYVLSESAEEVTRDWIKLHELNDQIEVMKSADISFFKDDKAFLKGFLDDMVTEVPQQLNETEIIVRMIALETRIYKLEGSANLLRESKEDILDNIREVLVAHANLIFQINKKLEKDAQNIERPE